MPKTTDKLEHTKINTICFVAGKSGGHIVPALTLAQQCIAQQRIAQQHNNANVLFFSTDTPLDHRIISHSSTVDTHVPLHLGNVPRSVWKLPQFVFNLATSFCKSMYHLLKHKPQSVISTGGYIAIPVCLAAWILRIPVTVYELNVVPGKAVKFLAPLATTIATCFTDTKKYLGSHAHKCTFTQYPVRYITRMPKEDASKTLGLSPDKKTILVLGGSQGSTFINKAIQQWIEKHPTKEVQLIHQTGAQHLNELITFYKVHNIPAVVFDYAQDLRAHYGAADVVICRSGAGTLFETLFFEKPCITIPLEGVAASHQVNNALSIAQSYPKLFTVVRQKDISNLHQYLNNAATTTTY